MAITGYQQPLNRALSYLDQLRTTANGPGRAAPQQTAPNDPNANPFDTGGGGGTAPTGGGTTGGIKLPTFDQSAGDIGIAPEGYQPLTGFPGYYYNPDTNSFRIMTNPTFDANGDPRASFRALTKAEDTALRGAYKQYLANGGGSGSTGSSGGSGTVPGVDKSMTDYQAATLAENQRQDRIAEAQAAITALMQRTQGAQTAKLDALPYAAGNMQYFNGLSPTSPAVTLGLADPFRVQGVPFDPNRIMGANGSNPQAAQDLATLRSLAGY